MERGCTEHLRLPPTGDAGLECLRERGTLCSTEPPSLGPWNDGFFLSHPWDSVPGRAFPPEAAQAPLSGPGCLSPPGRRRLAAARAGAGAWSLPSKPSHWPHAARPAAAAVRNTEPPALPSSFQSLTQQVVGSGNCQTSRRRKPSPPAVSRLTGCRRLCCPLAGSRMHCGQNPRGTPPECGLIPLLGRGQRRAELDQSCSVLGLTWTEALT